MSRCMNFVLIVNLVMSCHDHVSVALEILSRSTGRSQGEEDKEGRGTKKERKLTFVC